MTARRTWERTICRATTGTEGPVGSFEKPTALLTWCPPQQAPQAARPLPADSVWRGLFHQPEFGRDHTHSGHRHRTNRPAAGAAEYIPDTHANVHRGRARVWLIFISTELGYSRARDHQCVRAMLPSHGPSSWSPNRPISVLALTSIHPALRSRRALDQGDHTARLLP